MDGVPVPLGPLGFTQEGDVRLGDIGMDVLQSDAHGTHGDGQIFEAGEKVEEVMRGEGEFGRLDAGRGELQSPQ